MDIILKKFLSRNKSVLHREITAKYLFWICILLLQNVNSQNLVYNPSFEENYSCPSGPNQLSFAKGWSAPPNNDAEYFHRCSINSGYSIPHQGIHNYQEPHSGDAFVGAFFFNGWVWYREYVQTELISSLVNGKTYYVEYWVNLPSLMYSGRYAVNNIGLSFKTFFSDTTSDDSDGNVLPFNMDIYKYKNPVIDDTLNWVKINGVYKSLGGESFIVIGNFRGDDESIVVDQLNDSKHSQVAPTTSSTTFP